MAGGGGRGQAVTAVTAVLGQWGQLPQAEWAGLEVPAPPQLLRFSLQPLPPVPGVPCHGQARAGVPHKRGTDQSGEKVKKGLSQAGVTLCACRGEVQSRGGWKCLAEQLPLLSCSSPSAHTELAQLRL